MKLLVGLFGLYFVYAGFFFLMQRRMLYPVAYGGGDSGAVSPPPGVEQVWLSTSGGRVEAWYLPATADHPARADHGGPAVVFAHGNGEVIDHWPETMQGLARQGIAVLLVEYPGYNRSEGRPTAASITEAFEAGYDWLAGRSEIDANDIAGIGRSLGGAAIASLSLSRDLSALVLMSAFSSVGRIARRGYYLPGFLALDPFDNREAVSQFRGPVLIVHGRSDIQIPFYHAETLAKASSRTRLVAFDCGHNDCPPSWPEFLDLVVEFLAEQDASAP